MRINKLILHNFGIFANTNTLDFTSNKPVILIGGMNGRGKTTLLEAIIVALYGRRSFSVINGRLSFSKYLSSLINKSDGSYETYVELMFDLTSTETTEQYSVKRWWSLNNATPSLKTTVQKNGLYDQVLSDNWDIFIEEILPNAIAPFFFFDGEKISELANSDNEANMKSSIKNLLGIDIIDQAISDIRKIITTKKHIIKADIYAKEISVYESKIKDIEAETKEAIAQVGFLDIKKRNLTNRLNNAENAFLAMGGNLSSSRKELISRQSKIIDKLELINEQIVEMVTEDFPLLMMLPLLQDILIISENEREYKAIQTAIDQFPILYQEFKKEKTREIGFDEFINFVKTNAKKMEVIYNLSESGLFQLKALCSTVLAYQRKDMIHILEQRKELIEEQEKIESYLSIDIDEAASGKKYSEILSLTAELATVTEQYRLAQELVESKHALYDDLTRQHLKVIEKAIENLEGATDTKRVVTYAEYCINVLQAYKIRLQETKTHDLAQTMTQCFKKIASKQNLISEIKIDSPSLEFIYLNKEGDPINRALFSAGEKQLLVIAMLWALGICSKKQFPVIIDTPLARMDSAHRETLINNYFPKASEQTILLSTDAEIYGIYYDLIHPYTGKEFTLVYSDEEKQTVIHEGYFGGSNHVYQTDKTFRAG